MAPDRPELLVADARAWRSWLSTHRDSEGVRLVLAKNGTVQPTSLTHRDALEEALCFGWIDGQAGSRDESTWRVLFTPRRRRSLWSKRNVAIVERLTAEGRMDRAGIAEVERARADGRYQAAYAGSASIEVPPELAAALASNPRALATLEKLDRQNRYAVLYRVATARREDTKARLVERFVAMLERGESLHPRTDRPTPSSSSPRTAGSH